MDSLSGFPAVVQAVPTAITLGLPALNDPANYEYRSFSLNGSNGLPARGFIRAKATAP